MTSLSPGIPSAASPASGVCLALALCAFSAPAARANDQHHLVEVEAFASTLAIAKTVASACEGTRINLVMIEELRTRLHMVAADRPAFVEAGRQAVDALREGIEQAPSRQA